MKYELILEYEGTWEGAADFAGEITDEFGCSVMVNEVSDNGDVLKGDLNWEDARQALEKVHKADSTP
jgi:hypothetical protein